MPIEEALALRQERVSQLRSRLAELPLQQAEQLTLEIGCGHGHFLSAFAAAHRSHYCLAIDLIRERLDRARRKSDRLGLANVAWVQAEARDLLDAWPEAVLITGYVFILFPDPWPKRRHWKNRLIEPAFLHRLAAICAPGVALCFRTDHAPYFAEAVGHIEDHPAWRRGDVAGWPFEEATVFQTRAAGYQSVLAYRR